MLNIPYLGVNFIQLENNISQNLVAGTLNPVMKIDSGSSETVNQGLNMKLQHTHTTLSPRASNAKPVVTEAALDSSSNNQTIIDWVILKPIGEGCVLY